MAIYVTQKFHSTSSDNTVADAFQIFDVTAKIGERVGGYQDEINTFLLNNVNKLQGNSNSLITKIELTSTNAEGEIGKFIKITYSNNDEEELEQYIESPNIQEDNSTFITADEIDKLF